MTAAETAQVRRVVDASSPPEKLIEPLPGVSADSLKLAAQVAIVGIFMLTLGALLYVAESLVAPVVAAAVVSTLFRTVWAKIAHLKIPSAMYAFICVIAFAAVINLVIALLGGAISSWSSRGPEIMDALRTKAQVLEHPLAVIRQLHQALNSLLGGSPQEMKLELPTTALVAPVIGFLTPAIGELVLFFGSLFFFIYGRDRQRYFLVLMFRGQEARLRTLKIINEVESSLTRFIGMVSLINIAMGVVTALIAVVCGLPNALFLGVLAFLLNYIPYVGAAIVTVVLFLFGVINSPTLGTALIAPALFVAIATIEGHFITPNVVTRRLTIGPLTTFLCLAFWTWLWGPIGAFLATPLLIVAVLVRERVFAETSRLPE